MKDILKCKTFWAILIASVLSVLLGLKFSENEGTSPSNEEKTDTKLLIGTYGGHLYRYIFNRESGSFTMQDKIETVNPSYVTASCDEEGRTSVVAVCENGGESGVYSFEEKRGRLKLTAGLMQTGADPCYIMDMNGSYILTADYSGGSISVIPIKEGRLGERCEQLCFEGSGPVEGRQESSHIHQIRQVPTVENISEDWILASDLGADVIRLIFVSRIDSQMHGQSIMLVHISDIPCPPGSGPRHMEFSMDGKTLYCIAELSGEVLAYEISNPDGTPAFTLKQRIQADEVNAGGSADIHIPPSCKWLYTSHRLDNDGIAIFEIQEDGLLEKVGYTRTARHPRNFMITEDGKQLLVACRDDNLIQVFDIGDDGLLTLTPSVLRFENDRPSSVTTF